MILPSTLLCVKTRRRLPSRILFSATRILRPSITGLRSITARRLIAATFRRAFSRVMCRTLAATVAVFAHVLRARVASLTIYHMIVLIMYASNGNRTRIRGRIALVFVTYSLGNTRGGGSRHGICETLAQMRNVKTSRSVGSPQSLTKIVDT
jgi:hypothetical protein